MKINTVAPKYRKGITLEELMCNFVEIYAERIIKESERNLKWKRRNNH